MPHKFFFDLILNLFLIQGFNTVWEHRKWIIMQSQSNLVFLRNWMWNVNTDFISVNEPDQQHTSSSKPFMVEIFCFVWALRSCRPFSVSSLWLSLIQRIEGLDYQESHSDPWPLTFWVFLRRILTNRWMSKGSAIMMLCTFLMESHFYQGSKKPSLWK